MKTNKLSFFLIIATALIQTSYFTMVAKDEQGNNVSVPGIILKNNDNIRRFARSIARQEQAKNRSTAFKSSEFKKELYLDSLKDHNVRLELEE